MKITAQEEYGIRILIRLAACKDVNGMSIPQLSEAEGISTHYAAKIARTLRMAKFIRSTPGNKGGYVLAKNAKEIIIKNVLESLGNPLSNGINETNGTVMRFCTNSVDCSTRSLWQMLQMTLNHLLQKITLYDLAGMENTPTTIFTSLLEHEDIKINQ